MTTFFEMTLFQVSPPSENERLESPQATALCNWSPNDEKVTSYKSNSYKRRVTYIINIHQGLCDNEEYNIS